MRRWIRDQCKGAVRRLISAVMILATVTTVFAANNFLGTVPGSGTTFAGLLISAVMYPIAVICDATAGESQCQAVNSSGQASVLEANSASILTAVQAAIPAGTNLIGKVGIDQTTFGTTNGVVSAANTYNTIAASQTAQALTGGGGGATGDYLSHCVVIPTSTSPGVVTILDNSTAIYSFPGGSTSLSNLVPFTIPVGAKSTSGAWKITTGASLSVVCVGKFT